MPFLRDWEQVFGRLQNGREIPWRWSGSVGLPACDDQQLLGVLWASIIAQIPT